jgi:hypothetical protein
MPLTRGRKSEIVTHVRLDENLNEKHDGLHTNEIGKKYYFISLLRVLLEMPAIPTQFFFLMKKCIECLRFGFLPPWCFYTYKITRFSDAVEFSISFLIVAPFHIFFYISRYYTTLESCSSYYIIHRTHSFRFNTDLINSRFNQVFKHSFLINRPPIF